MSSVIRKVNLFRTGRNSLARLNCISRNLHDGIVPRIIETNRRCSRGRICKSYFRPTRNEYRFSKRLPWNYLNYQDINAEGSVYAELSNVIANSREFIVLLLITILRPIKITYLAEVCLPRCITHKFAIVLRRSFLFAKYIGKYIFSFLSSLPPPLSLSLSLSFSLSLWKSRTWT